MKSKQSHVVFLIYPHSILLKQILLDLYSSLDTSNELINDFDKNSNKHLYYKINNTKYLVLAK
jgi:hypothetical protein